MTKSKEERSNRKRRGYALFKRVTFGDSIHSDEMLGGSSRLLSDMSVEDDLVEAQHRLLAHENGSNQQVHPSFTDVPGYGTFVVPTVTGEGAAAAMKTPPVRSKRYRMVMLILLAFDAALITFLSVICFLVRSDGSASV